MYEDLITTNNKEVLNNGLEYAHARYKEEIDKYNVYNKRAMYPMSVITFIVTAISLFKDKTYYLLKDNATLSQLIITLIFVIIFCFVAITIPYFLRQTTVPNDTEFHTKINHENETVFKKWLIDSYRRDAKKYRRYNCIRGGLLFVMNVCLSIIVFAIIYALMSSFFPDFIFNPVSNFINNNKTI